MTLAHTITARRTCARPVRAGGRPQVTALNLIGHNITLPLAPG